MLPNENGPCLFTARFFDLHNEIIMIDLHTPNDIRLLFLFFPYNTIEYTQDVYLRLSLPQPHFHIVSLYPNLQQAFLETVWFFLFRILDNLYHTLYDLQLPSNGNCTSYKPIRTLYLFVDEFYSA